jgi:hypothetical protein
MNPQTSQSVLGDRPVADGFNLGGVHADLSLMDNQAQVLDLGLLELAFLRSEVEVMLLQAGEDLVDNGAVLFQGRCEDKDIVQVDSDLALNDQVSEDRVHEGLEGGRRVGESEEHDKRFKESLVGGEGSLPFLDTDVVVSPTNVELGEVLGALESVDDIRDEGERVPVLDCDLVELPIVLHKAELAVLLLDKEDWQCDQGLGWLDVAFPEVLFEEIDEFLLFVRQHGVDLGAYVGWGVRSEVDGMVPGLVSRETFRLLF